MPDPVQQFVEAFNRRDLGGMTALLAPDATAEVLGSGFGTEQGPDDIAAKSLTHMLGEADSSLTAELVDHAGDRLVVFLTSPTGSPPSAPPRLDSAARVAVRDDQVVRIEYIVGWFRLDDLRAIAASRGIEAVVPE